MEDRKKNIIMVLGIGINERGWASVISRHGRVTLLQLGLVEHVEVWDAGERIFCGPEIKLGNRWRSIDGMLLGTLMFLKTLRLILSLRRKGPVDVILTGYYSSGLAAILAQKLGLVSRTVSFLADYLPPRGSFLIRTHRRMTNGLAAL